MARYGISGRKVTSAAAGFIAQLRAASTARDLRVYEVGIFAGSAVAGQVGLYRTSAVGSGFTSIGPGAPLDNVSGAGAALVDTVASTAPTVTGVPFRQAQLPATIGAGIILPFPTGIVVPSSGSIVLQQLSTAAVTYDFYFDIDE